MGHTAFKPGDTAGYKTPSYDDLFRDFGLGDIFDAFSAGSGRARSRAGADLRYEIEISLSDAFYGTKNTVEVPHSYRVHNLPWFRSTTGFSAVTCPTNAGGPVRSGASSGVGASR